MPFAILCTIIGRASANIGTPCSVICPHLFQH
jgi:hypothetical protein